MYNVVNYMRRRDDRPANRMHLSHMFLVLNFSIYVTLLNKTIDIGISAASINRSHTTLSSKMIYWMNCFVFIKKIVVVLFTYLLHCVKVFVNYKRRRSDRLFRKVDLSHMFLVLNFTFWVTLINTTMYIGISTV